MQVKLPVSPYIASFEQMSSNKSTAADASP